MRVPLLLRAGVLAVLASACTADPEPEPEPEQRSAASSLRTPAPAASASPSPAPSARPASAPTPAPTPVVAQGDGVLRTVPGGAAVSGAGRDMSYRVEVEDGLGVDGPSFAREVDRILADPRSWGGSGRWALRRVAGGEAAFRVVLASPATTDRLCAPLRTRGRYSCRNGEFVVLNAARWLTGAESYAGLLPRYREYLVNHEVGHALGQGHAPCPGPGKPAPVMLQQSESLDGCTRNPWPYP